MPKRLFDMTLSLGACIILCPFMAAIALMILADSGRPVLFCIRCHGRTLQDKHTWLSQPTSFLQLKFRTMYVSKTPNHIVHIDNDPRITRVGRFLRATALDELPQLVNIFLGQMSFVGPRPVTLTELERRPGCPYSDIRQVPGYFSRCLVRPGLTGPAQLYLPKLANLEERFLADAKYAHKHCLWGDLKLLVLSLPISIQRQWEKPEAKRC